MRISASENLTLTAGKQLDIGARKDFTLAAGKQLSLYSREGAKLFSSNNDIDIQAQGGNVEIGGPGKLLIKNTGIKKAGSGSMQSVMKSFEPSTLIMSKAVDGLKIVLKK